MHKYVKDRAGQRYGSLVVLRHLGSKRVGKSKSPNAVWECQCDCGEIVPVLGRDLQTKHVQSCGCLRRDMLSELGKKNGKPLGVSLRNQILYHYKTGAKRRGYTWELTDEQFNVLLSGNCHYCGVEPNTERHGWKDSIKYNGIDRKNNKLGYIEGNVVSCCKPCQYAKRDRDYGEFLFWLRQAGDYQPAA